MKTVLVVGNETEDLDSLPVRLMPILEHRFLDTRFLRYDPTEDLPPDIPPSLVILDTIEGIDRVTVFPDLAAFTPPPHVSVHDYDLYVALKLMAKLGTVEAVKIIGVPMHGTTDSVRDGVIAALSS